MPSQNEFDRARGCLLGLAIGDALGAGVQGMRPGSFAPVTGYRGGGRYGLVPGEFSGNTSMALCLGHSISEVGWRLSDQARRYIRWCQTGDYSATGRCFDIGNTTRAALARFLETKDAQRSGERSEWSSSNGSIVRLGPVAIRYRHLYPGDVTRLGQLAEESSLPTHASEQCLSACRYLAVALAALIRGQDRDTVFSPSWRPLREIDGLFPLDPAVRAVVKGSYRTKQPPTIRAGGWVVECLEAALWAFHAASTFEEAVLRAVNLGENACGVGSVLGQLAGAAFGESGIGESLYRGLARKDMIEANLAGLLSARE